MISDDSPAPEWLMFWDEFEEILFKRSGISAIKVLESLKNQVLREFKSVWKYN